MPGPYSSIIFDATFEGQPNINAGRTGGIPGMKRFLRSFASDQSDNPFLPMYQEMVDEIGMGYMDQVRLQFAAKHGHTGETEQSMHSEFETPPGKMTYRIQMAGNVGFVINPLPPHFIAGTAFLNPQDKTAGRQTNFFSPFDYLSRTGVDWFQGGTESFSPDKSWYEDEIPGLAMLARRDFATLGGKISVLWDQGGAV